MYTDLVLIKQYIMSRQFKQLSQAKFITFLRALKKASDDIISADQAYEKVLNVAKLGEFNIHTEHHVYPDLGIKRDFYIIRVHGRTLEDYNRDTLQGLIDLGFLIDRYEDEEQKYAMITTSDPTRSIDLAKLMLYDAVIILINSGFNASPLQKYVNHDNIVDYILDDIWYLDNQLENIVSDAITEAEDAEDIEDPTDGELAMYYILRSQLPTRDSHELMNEMLKGSELDIDYDDLEGIDVIRRAYMARIFNVFMN